MNRLLCFLCAVALLPAAQLHAAFLRNIPVTVVQPNGDTLHLYASGDEFHSWLHDHDQYTIVQDHTNGYYKYAIRTKGGIGPSRYIVGKADPELLGLAKAVNLSPRDIQRKRDAVLQSIPATRAYSPTRGTINQIVVFIRFSDEPEFSKPLSSYNDLFNVPTAGAISELNYFREVSYGRLAVSSTFYPSSGGESIVSYRDAHPRGYYQPFDATTNPIGCTDYNRWDREVTLVSNAVAFVSSQVPAGLDIDADGDDIVDSIIFIIKGEPTAWSTLLWPHAAFVATASAQINGKRACNYNLQLESMTYLGVLVHEMMHTLGAPDLYHYSHDEFMPVGGWDPMEAIATPPEHIGAYMKFRYLKWIDNIPEITRTGTYTLNPLGTSPDCCYKISSSATSQFYIVEFRKKQGTFEVDIPGEGLLVYRIFTGTTGNAAGPPDEVYIYRPDGALTTPGNLVLAALSAESGRTSIGPSTNPIPFLLSGQDGGLSISEVSAVGSQMTMKVTVGSAAPLLAHYPFDNGTAEDLTGSGYTGTVFGATAVADRFGAAQGALDFNGTNNRVTTAGLHVPANDFSVSLWFKTGAIAPPKYECLIGDAGDSKGFRVARNPLHGDSLEFQIRTENAGSRDVVFGLLPADAGQWVHLVGVSDNGHLAVYKNGILQNSSEGLPATPQTDYPVGIGCDLYERDGFLTGSLDDIRIYSVALTQIQIQSLYHEGGWPLAPVLSSPANGATGVSTSPVLAWGATSDATSYRVQLSTGSSFATLAYDSAGITGTSHEAAWLSGATQYWWRVYGTSAGGGSFPSSARSFTTLTGPYVGSRLTLPGTIEVECYDAGGEGITYHDMDAENFGATNGSRCRTAEGVDIEPCQDPEGGMFNIAWARPGEWTRYAVTVSEAGSYQMDARVATSQHGRFHLELDGTDITGPVQFGPTGGWQTWTTVSRTVSLPSGDHYLYLKMDTADSSYHVGNINRLGFSRLTVLAAPILSSPANRAINVNTSALLGWESVPAALWYRVQLASDSVLQNLAADTMVTGALTLTTPALAHDRMYYWRVRAGNANALSDWSPGWNFTTIVQLPAQVALFSPLDMALVGADSVRFFWRSSQPAVERYWLEMASDSLFVTHVTDSTLTDTSTVVRNLTSGQNYWWKVAAKNKAGWGYFSPVRSFSVLTTGVLSNLGVPDRFSLSQNYPNPFNPSTTIRYGLPQNSYVTLTVYNTLGQVVSQLISGQMEAGYHEAGFRADDLASGVYYYRLRAGDFTEARKLVVVK